MLETSNSDFIPMSFWEVSILKLPLVAIRIVELAGLAPGLLPHSEAKDGFPNSLRSLCRCDADWFGSIYLLHW